MYTQKQNRTLLFLIAGIIAGWLFTAVNIILQMSFGSMPFSFAEYIKIRQNNPGGYFFDFFPSLLFGLVGYIFGNIISNFQIKIKKLENYAQDRVFTVLKSIEEIRAGKAQLKTKFAQEDIEIKSALEDLQADLLKRTEEEKQRQKEDERRNRTSEGLAKFSAILRENSDDIKKLGDSILSEFVKYIDAVQAGFFVVNDKLNGQKGEKQIEHISAFAYDRKKFTDQIIEWGEGLVGACIIEKETIHIPQVTEAYLQITSGLGRSNPKSILIVPLKTQDNIVQGALEIASFKNFESHIINFTEQVAESIATTITILKNNMQTALLLEESRQQAKELSEQDERMRKTLKEMKELQIEAALQSEEFISFTNSVNHTMIRAEYDIDGYLLYANTMFLDILGYESNSQVEGKHIFEFINKRDQVWFKEVWKRLISGGKHFEGYMNHLTVDKKDAWIITTYVSVRDVDGNPGKILFLGIDNTLQKEQSLDYEGQITALNQSSLKVEISPAGKIISAGMRFAGFLRILTVEDVKNKLFIDLLDPEVKQEFNRIWKSIMNGNPTERTLAFINSNFEKVWAYGTFSIVRDMYGQISKVIFIGSDVTEQYKMEKQNLKQTHQLKIQEKELQEAKLELSKKLREAREEMKQQFRETETVKLLNDKMLDNIIDAVVTINQDNKIEFFNSAAEVLWGLKREDVLNKDVSVIFPGSPKDRSKLYMRDFFTIKQEKISLYTRKKVFLVNKTGKPIPVLMTLSDAVIGIRYRLTAFIQKIEND